MLLPSLAPSSQQQQQRQLEHQPPESDQDTPKLAVGSGWRLMASSVGGGGGGSQGRRSAEAEEVPLLGGGAGGEGWESVDASEASLTLPQRNFSTAHLLAPMVGRSTVAGVSPPHAVPSSGDGWSGRGGFSGRARAKVSSRRALRHHLHLHCLDCIHAMCFCKSLPPCCACCAAPGGCR